jgi:Spy/CpxP family protein refolding chaperone
MNRVRFIAALALFVFMGTWVAAQDAPQEDPQTRMRLRENISTLYLLRLTRALELTEEQTARLFPVLTRIEREKAESQRRMNLGLRDLRAALADRGAKEGPILDLVERVRAERLAIRQKDDEAEAALDEVLTPVQKARFLIFTVDFYRNLGLQLDRARQMRPGPKRRP